MHKSSQVEAAHGLQTPFLVRQNRRELAHPADPARAPAETSDPAPVLPAGQLASEDISARLPRPILWLAFAGWVVCCGMLFITLVQRGDSCDPRPRLDGGRPPTKRDGPAEAAWPGTPKHPARSDRHRQNGAVVNVPETRSRSLSSATSPF